jgi:CSLREA domain-containing protein
MEENIVKQKHLFQTITRLILAKGTRLLALAVLLAGFAFTVQPAPLAYAATLTVTAGAPDVLANDESCSLREAITNANDNATTWADCAPAGAQSAQVVALLLALVIASRNEHDPSLASTSGAPAVTVNVAA